MEPETPEEERQRYAEALIALKGTGFIPVGGWRFTKNGVTYDLSATNLRIVEQLEREGRLTVVKPEDTAMSLAETLLNNTVETLASLPEMEWDAVIRFLAPSLLQNRPNDFVRILMDRAMLRSKGDGNPTRHLQLIMRDQGLELQHAQY